MQTTGPISFGLTIVDENKRAIYYNPEFIDVVVKALAMKCRWQIRKFRPYAENMICFIDEPILSAFGSSTYVSVTRDDVVAKLGEVIEAVHAEGALAGVHCCGNTEWSILIDAGVDIVNFDAFDYGETIALYPEAVKRASASAARRWPGASFPPTAPRSRRRRRNRWWRNSTRWSQSLAKATGLDGRADLPAGTHHAFLRHRFAAGGRCRARVRALCTRPAPCLRGASRDGIDRQQVAWH